MSVQAISWVLDDSKARGLARLVLISIANHASKFGCRSFPSTKLISEEAGVSEREVRYSVRELVDLGELAVRYKASDLGTNDYCLEKMHPASCAECMERATRQRPAKKHHGTRQALAPEPSLTVVEPSEPARSEVAKKITGQPQHTTQKRAATNLLSKKPPTAILTDVRRVAATKTFVRFDPEIEQLQRGIFRKRVMAAYFDCGSQGEEAACREALDQAILDLLTSRGTVELRGVDEKELRDACWKRLAPLLRVFAALSDYSRRQDEVLRAILRITCEEALRLKREHVGESTPSELAGD